MDLLEYLKFLEKRYEEVLESMPYSRAIGNPNENGISIRKRDYRKQIIDDENRRITEWKKEKHELEELIEKAKTKIKDRISEEVSRNEQESILKKQSKETETEGNLWLLINGVNHRFNSEQEIIDFFSTEDGFLSIIPEETLNLLLEIGETVSLQKLAKKYGGHIAEMMLSGKQEVVDAWCNNKLLPYLKRVKEKHLKLEVEKIGDIDVIKNIKRKRVNLQNAKNDCSNKWEKYPKLQLIDICKKYLNNHKIEKKPNYPPEKLANLISSTKHQNEPDR